MAANRKTNAKVAMQTVFFLFVSAAILLFVLIKKLGVTISDPSFIQSFMASYAEDVFFFLLVGAAAFIYSMRRPEEELLENRIWYLYSSEQATDEVLNYNKEQIKKLAAFAVNGKAKIMVNEYNAELRAYRVYFSKEYTLQNLFKDREYSDTITVRINPDKIEDKQMELGVNGHGNRLLGEVLTIQTTVLGETPERHIEHTSQIYENFKKEIKIRIPPNGRTQYEFQYWLWCLVGEPHDTRVLRYTEFVETSLQNLWSGKVGFSLEGQEGKVEYIDSNTTYKMKDREKFTPADVITFWWREPRLPPDSKN